VTLFLPPQKQQGTDQYTLRGSKSFCVAGGSSCAGASAQMPPLHAWVAVAWHSGHNPDFQPLRARQGCVHRSHEMRVPDV